MERRNNEMNALTILSSDVLSSSATACGDNVYQGVDDIVVLSFTSSFQASSSSLDKYRWNVILPRLQEGGQ